MTSKLHTVAALAAAFGVTEHRVKMWVRAGCPSRRRKSRRGPPHHVFDALAVKTWIVSRGIVPKRIPPGPPDAQPPPSQPEPPPQSDAVALSAPGIVGYVERLRQQERISFAGWAREIRRRNPDPALLAILARDHRYAGEQLRKVEKDLPGILLKTRILVRADDAAAELADIAREIQTQLLQLPGRLAGAIARKSATQVQAILDTEVRQTLGRLAQRIEAQPGLPTGKETAV